MLALRHTQAPLVSMQPLLLHDVDALLQEPKAALALHEEQKPTQWRSEARVPYERSHRVDANLRARQIQPSKYRDDGT